MSLGNPYGAIARCIMNPDKTVDYFLDVNDSNKKMDGSAVDWALVESSGQNVMVQIPKFYSCKKWVEETQSMFFGVSATPKETTYIAESDWVVHPAFFKDQNKACDDPTSVPVEVPFRYVGAFRAWKDSKGRLRSLPNKTYTLNSLASHILSAKTSGLGFCCFDFELMYAIQMLYITEYSNPDSQSTLGKGSIHWQWQPGGGGTPYQTTYLNTGTTLLNGNKSTIASELVGNKAISYRGIEELYGAISCYLEGAYVSNSNGVNLRGKWVAPGYVASGITRTIRPNIESGFIPMTTSQVVGSGLTDLGCIGDGYLMLSGNGGATTNNIGIFSINTTTSDSLSTRLAL